MAVRSRNRERTLRAPASDSDRSEFRGFIRVLIIVCAEKNTEKSILHESNTVKTSATVGIHCPADGDVFGPGTSWQISLWISYSLFVISEFRKDYTPCLT